MDHADFVRRSDAGREKYRRKGWLKSDLRRQLDFDDGLVPGKNTELITAKEEEDEEDSEWSEVDLALPPTHHPRAAPSSGVAAPAPMPLLSSGKGGSSLNRGLVPRGQDPNAALGGFEIEFGGSREDEDWVRRFVPPTSNRKKGRDRGNERGSSEDVSEHDEED